jgi:predicted negative regulator of RcsB-dependent stress response
MPQPQPTGEDRFVQSTFELAAWAQRNTRTLILGVAALVIVGFSVKYYLDYKHSIEETASSELRAIRFETASVDPSAAVDRLRAFIVRYEGSSYAREGRVLLAYSLLNSNRASEAIQPAQQAITDLDDDIISLRGAFLLAAAHEEVGDTAAAISVYQDIGNAVELRIEKSRALQSAARLLAASGNHLGAAELYEELAEYTPEEAPARGFFIMRAAEMRAQNLVTSRAPVGDPEGS